MSSSGSSSSSPDVLTAVVLGVGVGGGFVIVPALVLILGMFGVLVCAYRGREVAHAHHD